MDSVRDPFNFGCYIPDIIKAMGKKDAHFVLAVGSNDDWIAFIEKDDNPDEVLAWGVADDPEDAINLMLSHTLTNAA